MLVDCQLGMQIVHVRKAFYASKMPQICLKEFGKLWIIFAET